VRHLGLLPVILLVASVASAQWVEDSIDVGGRWVGSLAYNSREDVIYGLSNTGDFVFAIACSSNAVIARIDANYPRSLSYDATDSRLYCTFGNGDESLLVISGVTHERLQALPLASANTTLWDGVYNRLYVTCGYENQVAVIDCATDSVVARIDVGRHPLRLHLNTRHDKLYVQNYDDGSVSIVDRASLRVIKTVDIETAPLAGYYSESVDKYYADDGPNQVAVIDGDLDSVVTRALLPNLGAVSAITGTRRDRVVVVAQYGSGIGWVYAIDGDADTLLSSLDVGRYPRALHWSSVTDLVYCVNGMSDDVTVIAGDGSAVLKTVRVGDAPQALLAVPTRGRIYVGHNNGRYVYVIKDRTGGIAEQDPVAVERWAGSTVMRASDLARVEGCIIDVQGRVLASGQSEIANRISEMPPGIYFVREASGAGRQATTTRKIVAK